MKIGIIGGAGLVGSNLAFALQMAGVGSELVLVDANQQGAAGQALDLLHGCAYTHSQRIRAGGYDALEGADAVVITAGLRRKPDESRLDLINRNVQLFLSVLGDLKNVTVSPNCHLIVVTNPVDILTQLAAETSGLPRHRVIGLGTVLDTLRFRSLLAAHFGVAATQMQAMILGEHGDSMVPIWSTACVDGVPLPSLPGYDQSAVMKIFERTRKSGAEVISLKGGAGYAVGVAILEVLKAIAYDTKAVLPVSTWQDGKYGIKDVCLSVPTRLGKKGVEECIEMELWPKESAALRASSEALLDTLNKVRVKA
jgi:L-lactate dehydrogenase